MSEQYLKMADVFAHGDVKTRATLSANILSGTALILHGEQAEYAAHAINSHDELVRQRNDLLDAMRQTLAMLRTTSHGPSAANKAEDMLHAAICSLGSGHSPDAWKVMPDGYVIVGRAEISMVISVLNRDAEDGRPVRKEMADELIHSMERAMLAAAPKLGGE